MKHTSPSFQRIHRLLAGIFLATTLGFSTYASDQAGSVHWSGWSDDVFTKAQQEKKLVILDLEAVWCHWCHVMDEKTYSDPAVSAILGKSYLPVKVDQDSRPDLSNRYQDYGWPATIIFAPDGSELAKRSGFIPPDEMKALLAKLAKDPKPEEEASSSAAAAEVPVASALSDDIRKELEATNLETYDQEYGSWGSGGHKFMDWDSVEYSLSKAKKGDKQAEAMAKQTLDAQIAIIDPVWGGVYQYSTGGVWTNPHFEKIMSVQAENLRTYAQAYSYFKDPKYLDAAQKIAGYLETFLLGPDGGFYTSQDADLVQGEHSAEFFDLNDTERRKLGIPRVDKHQYARENGWAINAFVALYNASGNTRYLQEAEKAANWVITNRSIPSGGYRHDVTDKAGPYLGDNLAMTRAFLSLYFATGGRDWLKKAEETAQFIQDTFKNTPSENKPAQPGYITAKPFSKVAAVFPKPNRDENMTLVRTMNLLHHATANPLYRQMAETSMTYLAQPEIARQLYTGTTLLADLEMRQTPLHITIVGHKDDPAAQALVQSALQYPAAYKRLDWWDKREGPMPNPDVQYPELPKPAAFVCTNNRCSLPVFKADDLPNLVDRLTH